MLRVKNRCLNKGSNIITKRETDRKKELKRRKTLASGAEMYDYSEQRLALLSAIHIQAVPAASTALGGGGEHRKKLNTRFQTTVSYWKRTTHSHTFFLQESTTMLQDDTVCSLDSLCSFVWKTPARRV